MADRKYYVRCEQGCLFESMTKEQILTAIAQAVSTGEIKDVNTGFIGSVIEMNGGKGVTFWVGTTAQYNALTEKDDYCIYIKTDDTSEEDTNKAIKELQDALTSAFDKIPPQAQIKVVTIGGGVVCKDEEGNTVKGVQNDNVWTFSVPYYGTYTITNTADGYAKTATVEVTAVKQYDAVLTACDDTFADNDWQTIINVAETGVVPDAWKVGDEKTMTIDGTDYLLRIIGRAHDTYANGGTAPLTLAFIAKSGVYPFPLENVTMNDTDTNVGGWEQCAMRTTTLPAFLAKMPENIRKAIKPVTKATSAGNKSATISVSEDGLFLLSEVELFGTTDRTHPGEGTQYSYFKSGNDNVIDFGTGTASWFRSPYKADAQKFVAKGIDSDGESYLGVSNATKQYCALPAFCL